MIRRPNSAILCGILFLTAITAARAQDPGLRTVHVFVALADNQHPGIIPVPAKLGNGEDPEHNLYWGSAFGVKTFFTRSEDWTRISCEEKDKTEVLERCVFNKCVSGGGCVPWHRNRAGDSRLSGLRRWRRRRDLESRPAGSSVLQLPIRGAANLVAYIGHDGLMDFQLQRFPQKKNEVRRDAIVLACASKQYFTEAVHASGA